MKLLHTPRGAAPVVIAALGVFLLCLSAPGCSGSSGTQESGTPRETMHDDVSTPPGTSAESDLPKGKFTVQLGAYQSEDAGRQIASRAQTRFSRRVYTVYDAADHLYKVMLGTFDTKDQAREFRDTIVRQYPDDYRDAWVSELTN